jgi:hypothetical protein
MAIGAVASEQETSTMSSAPKAPATHPTLAPTLLFFGAVLTAAALGLFASAASASSSKFIYESCDSALPGGGPVSAQFAAGAGFTPFDTCAQPNGSIGIIETAPTSATYAFWSVSVPATPGGFVESLTISASACGLGTGNDHTFIYEQGWPGNCTGESQRVFHIRDSAPTGPFNLGGGAGFTIFMNCDGNVGPCSAGPWIGAHYLAATEVDPKPPSVPALGGSLLGGGVLRGHQGISAEAVDEGGGLSKLGVSVNGLPASQPAVGNCNLLTVGNPSYQGVVAATPTPCPPKLKGTWALDTAAYPFHDGANTVEVCATDYSSVREATANQTCSAPQTVTVDNSCTESPVAGGEILSTQFARSHREQVTVPYNTTAKVTGELADNAGDAISGATICVQMATQGSRRGLQPVGTATTDANGHFVYKVAPGPNRKVLIGYRHDTFQVARSVRYFAHAKPTLKISPGQVETGGEIRIRGELPGARSAGRVVVLQASALHSDRWYTFRRATTNKAGVFHSRYRFDATTMATTYRIRAVVPRQHGYPWEIGHSRPALVEVR